jgi:hypothetical protein
LTPAPFCRSSGENWSDVEQSIPIAWTPCRFGGERPWFSCPSVTSNGVRCRRRVAMLYGAGRLFACRHCCGLAYASQHESSHARGLRKSQKIRMQLGGSANMLDDFPSKSAGAFRTIVFFPVLLVGSISRPRSKSTWSHLRCNISRSRAPVKISSRTAAAACGPITERRLPSLGACLALGFVSSTAYGSRTFL